MRAEAAITDFLPEPGSLVVLRMPMEYAEYAQALGEKLADGLRKHGFDNLVLTLPTEFDLAAMTAEQVRTMVEAELSRVGL